MKRVLTRPEPRKNPLNDSTDSAIKAPLRSNTAGAAADSGRPRSLSKSKLLAFRQCPRRLWLEVNRPDLQETSEGAQRRFDSGHMVGALARSQYDPKGRGAVIDVKLEDYEGAFARTHALMQSSQPVFEAGFSAVGALAFADIMLPRVAQGARVWRMVEVKSAASVKDYHEDDAAIQAHVARAAGVPLASIAIAHIDSKWVYPGGNDYKGLLKEVDVSKKAFSRAAEVTQWIAGAQATLRETVEPSRRTGSHCADPFECGFASHCRLSEPQAKFPVSWLPETRSQALQAHLADPDNIDMRQVPDELLNAKQLRVKSQTLEGVPWFDQKGAATALRGHAAPMYFLDFESVNFVIPIWAGTRPYQQITFQFSLHRLLPKGVLEHEEFLDLSGEDPSASFVAALVKACGSKGPVFVYSASFEKTRMAELAERVPRSKAKLMAISKRVVDLLPIARTHYYHPSQQGRWSIKDVLPALVPELNYGQLDGVQDGMGAMDAYREACAPSAAGARKAQIRDQLLAYCKLDTYAMVKVWQAFAGKQHLRL